MTLLITQSWKIGSDLTLTEISCTVFHHLEVVSINMRGKLGNSPQHMPDLLQCSLAALVRTRHPLPISLSLILFPLSLFSYQMHVHSITKKIPPKNNTNIYSLSSLQLYIRTEWQLWACDVLIRKAVSTCREMAIWLVFLGKFLR